MKVAITGASGVVGRPVAVRLVEAGHQVAALARSDSAAERVASLGAVPIRGDVLDSSSLEALVSGAEWVFHVAGVNEVCPTDPRLMDRVNIEGTRNVLEACERAGVGRLVHTSSAVTIGEAPGTVGTEDTPHRGWYLSRYERSKHLSERLLFESARSVEVVAVNPSSVQGPGRATGTGKLVLDVAEGRLGFVVETKASMVDIDDCARAHLLAAAKGTPGERYLISGHSFSVSEVLQLFGELTGRELRPRFLPGWVASAGAAVVELGSKLAGRRPFVCREMIRVLRAGHVYDGSRATRELGLEYTALEDTIRRTLEWFDQQGLLA